VSACRILWAEDKLNEFRTFSKTLRLYLEDKNLFCDIVNVSDGDAIYRLLATERFDLLIADIQMERWGGIAAVEDLAKLYPDLPKIIVSGRTGDTNLVPILKRFVHEGALRSYFPKQPREPWCSACYEVLKAKLVDSRRRERIFVVHGHDLQARNELEVVLRRLELEPVILASTGGSGLTIIEALELHIGNARTRVRFGIVLFTPDDMGYSIKDGPDRLMQRARQNVILESGMLIGAIGRRNVVILIKGSVERPSDIDGLIYLPFQVHVLEVVPKLQQRLLESGIELSPEAMARADT
jgi:CheY-like chemotaxis protein